LDIAVLVAFAQLDADHHPLAVNVGGAQMHRFTDAHPGAVHGAEDDMVSKGGSRLQQLQDFLRTENDRQPMIFLGRGNELRRPIALQSNGVQEPEGANREYSGANGHLSLVRQVDLIGTDLFRA